MAAAASGKAEHLASTISLEAKTQWAPDPSGPWFCCPAQRCIVRQTKRFQTTVSLQKGFASPKVRSVFLWFGFNWPLE